MGFVQTLAHDLLSVGHLELNKVRRSLKNDQHVVLDFSNVFGELRVWEKNAIPQTAYFSFEEKQGRRKAKDLVVVFCPRESLIMRIWHDVHD
jgi:hypothetical protein